MSDPLNDLQTLQNELMGRWQGPSEIGNYILRPPEPQIEEWLGLIENVRQALIAANPPADETPPAKAKK